jgi:hypothetical protein
MHRARNYVPERGWSKWKQQDTRWYVSCTVIPGIVKAVHWYVMWSKCVISMMIPTLKIQREIILSQRRRGYKSRQKNKRNDDDFLVVWYLSIQPRQYYSLSLRFSSPNWYKCTVPALLVQRCTNIRCWTHNFQHDKFRAKKRRTLLSPRLPHGLQVVIYSIRAHSFSAARPANTVTPDAAALDDIGSWWWSFDSWTHAAITRTFVDVFSSLLVGCRSIGRKLSVVWLACGMILKIYFLSNDHSPQTWKLTDSSNTESFTGASGGLAKRLW